MVNETYENKMKKCQEFFYKLADILKEEYEVIESCNADCSVYLIPNGTVNELSYYGKPDASFRVSDHWNWYANLQKCDKPEYIQCMSVNAPWCKHRKDDKATKPVIAIQVSMIFPDGKYHAIYGESFDRKKKTWEWLETDPMRVASAVKERS